MGKKNYRPKASKALLEHLRMRYWESIVEPLLTQDGPTSKEHIVWNLSQAGCKRPYPSQLIKYMIDQGAVEVIRSNGHVYLQKSALNAIPKFHSLRGAN